MADATATIEGRMRPQRERRAPAKFRDFQADVGLAALQRLNMLDHHKLPLLSRIGSKTETSVIRVNNCRRSLKEKLVDSYTKISSCTSDGDSKEIIPVEQPNPHACIKSECARRSRLGSHRRSERLSKANATNVVLREIIPVDEPNPHACIKSECAQRSKLGSHRRSQRLSKANSTNVVLREIIPVDEPNPHACIKSDRTQRSRSGSHRRSKRISKANSTDVSSEIIPVDQPKIKCKQRSRSGSHRRRKRISKANSTESILPKRLSNILFDHYFQNMWSESSEERREMCTFLNCFSFDRYVGEHSRKRVLGWINNLNIFSKKYVFVPILLWSHWSLLILCHFGESLDSKTITPCMLLLDSLQSHSSISELEPIIRRFVLEIFETKGRPESKVMVENLPLLVPKVPQQKNFTDCGLFVLYYLYLFLEYAPENLSVSDGYPYFMTENWFTRKDLKIFYNKLEAFGPEFQSETDEESFDSSGISCLGTTCPDSE